MEKLNRKQCIFVEEYLRCWNGSEAARRAGYKGRVEVTASKLLRKANIQKLIAARVDEKAMKADEVLLALAEHARSSVEDFITIQGRGFRFDMKKAKDAGKLHLLKSITKGPKGTRIELYDAQRALETLGKALGVLTERVDITSQGDKIDVVFYIPSNERELINDDPKD